MDSVTLQVLPPLNDLNQKHINLKYLQKGVGTRAKGPSAAKRSDFTSQNVGSAEGELSGRDETGLSRSETLRLMKKAPEFRDDLAVIARKLKGEEELQEPSVPQVSSLSINVGKKKTQGSSQYVSNSFRSHQGQAAFPGSMKSSLVGKEKPVLSTRPGEQDAYGKADGGRRRPETSQDRKAANPKEHQKSQVSMSIKDGGKHDIEIIYNADKKSRQNLGVQSQYTSTKNQESLGGTNINDLIASKLAKAEGSSISNISQTKDGLNKKKPASGARPDGTDSSTRGYQSEGQSVKGQQAISGSAQFKQQSSQNQIAKSGESGPKGYSSSKEAEKKSPGLSGPSSAQKAKDLAGPRDRLPTIIEQEVTMEDQLYQMKIKELSKKYPYSLTEQERLMLKFLKQNRNA